MKSFTLFFIVLTLSLGSCRNTLPKQTQEGSSSLKAVYDDDYSLKVAKIPGEPFYQFETCLTPAHLNKHGSNLSSKDSCVAALKVGDENVTFQIETGTLEELALSDEERECLLKMQHEWGDYRARVKSQIAADHVSMANSHPLAIGATAVALAVPGAGVPLILGLDTIDDTHDIIKIIRKNPGTSRAKEVTKRLMKITKRIPIIIGLVAGGSAATYGVLNFNKWLAGVPQAKDRLKKKKSQIEEFNVLLQSSSPLLSTDPSHNKKVESVKAVLSYLAIAWSAANTSSEATTTHYCYPKITTENTVEPDCHLQELSLR